MKSEFASRLLTSCLLLIVATDCGGGAVYENGSGSSSTGPFALSGGKHSAYWSASPTRCLESLAIESAVNGYQFWEIVAPGPVTGQRPASAGASGESDFSLATGLYRLKATSLA